MALRLGLITASGSGEILNPICVGRACVSMRNGSASLAAAASRDLSCCLGDHETETWCAGGRGPDPPSVYRPSSSGHDLQKLCATSSGGSGAPVPPAVA